MALFPGRLMIILRKRNGFVPQVQLANRKFSMKPEDEKADGQHNVDKIWIPSWLRSLILRPIGYPYNIGVDFQEGSNCHYYDVPKEMFYNVLDRAIKAEKEVAKKEEQLNIVQEELSKILIPLTVRHYSFVIEERCPVTVQVPASESKGSKNFEKMFTKRTYQWKAIFDQHPKDIYVAFILSELKQYFMNKHGITVMNEEWTAEYDLFVLNFCYSISKAIDYGNKLVAHFEHSGERLNSLNIYARPVDEYVTLFYNALVGHIIDA